MGPFTMLGQAVSERYAKARFEEETFPEIAGSCLLESRLLETVEPEQVVQWLMSGQGAPQQDTYEFGQPPIIVYAEANFYIQVLFWIDGTTTIHNHGFGGAFGVLGGSSVQSLYDFQAEDPAPMPLLLGKMNFLSAELLNRGDVRPINPGRSTHSLFHLDRPSVSVVVRTPDSVKHRAQYNFLNPGLAVDHRYAPSVQIIQLRMLESLAKTNMDLFWTSAEQLVLVSSPWMLYKLLAAAFPKRADGERWERVMQGARERNPHMADRIVECLRVQEREQRIVALRAAIHDPIHRFFLALLLNIPNRDLIYRFIRERFPSSDPESLILRWLSEIFHEERTGLRLTPLTVQLVKLALRNTNFEKSRPILQSYVRTGREKEDELRLQAAWKEIQAVDVLQPLFTGATVE